MRTLLPLGVALAALTGGCAMSIPETLPYPKAHVAMGPQAAQYPGPAERAPSAAEPAPGYSLCARTSVAARSLSSAQAAGGWTFGALGVAATGTGVVATVVNNQQPRLMAAAGLTLGGVALGIVAYHLFLRSAASARLGQAADLAMLDGDDHRAFESCVRAKAAWEVSKADPEGVTREMLDQEQRDNRKLREEIERLKKGLGPAEAAPPAPPAPAH